ncbi:MAG TPA: hypothetical protein VF137_10075 [Candidatus Dormibacteraeota bacterium]
MTISEPSVALGVLAALSALLLAATARDFRPAPLSVATAVLAVAAVSIAPDLGVIALVLLLLAAAQLRATGDLGPVRSAGLAAGLLAVAMLAATPDPRSGRLAALVAALALAGAVGLVPHLAEAEEGDTGRTAVAMRAFVMPSVAFALFERVHAALPPGSFRVFGGVLLALGCANVLWGLAGALTDDEERAWRYAYSADWGLALIGLGLLSPDGSAGAFLMLLSVLLLRLPLLFRPSNWLAAAALAGLAPFGGFVARLLILRAATAVAWPLALALGLALVLWLPATRRQLQPGSRARGRALIAQLAPLGVTLAAGIYPAGFLRPLGL